MNASSNDNSRLDDLESRLAFQDDLIEQLNAVIARQDRELLNLTRRLKDLELRIVELSEAAASPGGSSGHEVPPHY